MDRPTVTMEYADRYFESRLRSSEWNTATEEERQQALTQASFLISGAFTFYDTAYSLEDDGVVVWHERILASVCEEAIWLLAHDPSQIPDALFKGIASASAGSVSATFDKRFVIPWICPLVPILVGTLGFYIDDEYGSVAYTTLLSM